MPQKFSLFFEKASIMIQIMDVEFETAAANFVHKAIGNFVALLGHDLEGGLECMGSVDIHERRGEVTARGRFHVVRQDEAARCTVRPEPDEGNLVAALGSHG